jgi:hypothetical protein
MAIRPIDLIGLKCETKTKINELIQRYYDDSEGRANVPWKEIALIFRYDLSIPMTTTPTRLKKTYNEAGWIVTCETQSFEKDGLLQKHTFLCFEAKK